MKTKFGLSFDYNLSDYNLVNSTKIRYHAI